jgi:hypothetical protein
MKNILLILAISFSSASFAQGNLQFNQVVNGSVDANIIDYNESGSITVPAGKVWKIEAVSYFAYPGMTFQQSMGGNSAQAWIGNQQVVSTNSNLPVQVPIWLSEGTYTVKLKAAYGSATPVRLSWSVIEFNIVP